LKNEWSEGGCWLSQLEGNFRLLNNLPFKNFMLVLRNDVTEKVFFFQRNKMIGGEDIECHFDQKANVYQEESRRIRGISQTSNIH
jgi:hypothetical protein